MDKEGQPPLWQEVASAERDARYNLGDICAAVNKQIGVSGERALDVYRLRRYCQGRFLLSDRAQIALVGVFELGYSEEDLAARLQSEWARRRATPALSESDVTPSGDVLNVVAEDGVASDGSTVPADGDVGAAGASLEAAVASDGADTSCEADSGDGPTDGSNAQVPGEEASGPLYVRATDKREYWKAFGTWARGARIEAGFTAEVLAELVVQAHPELALWERTSDHLCSMERGRAGNVTMEFRRAVVEALDEVLRRHAFPMATWGEAVPVAPPSLRMLTRSRGRKGAKPATVKERPEWIESSLKALASALRAIPERRAEIARRVGIGEHVVEGYARGAYLGVDLGLLERFERTLEALGLSVLLHPAPFDLAQHRWPDSVSLAPSAPPRDAVDDGDPGWTTGEEDVPPLPPRSTAAPVVVEVVERLRAAPLPAIQSEPDPVLVADLARRFNRVSIEDLETGHPSPLGHLFGILFSLLWGMLPGMASGSPEVQVPPMTDEEGYRALELLLVAFLELQGTRRGDPAYPVARLLDDGMSAVAARLTDAAPASRVLKLLFANGATSGMGGWERPARTIEEANAMAAALIDTFKEGSITWWHLDSALRAFLVGIWIAYENEQDPLECQRRFPDLWAQMYWPEDLTVGGNGPPPRSIEDDLSGASALEDAG